MFEWARMSLNSCHLHILCKLWFFCCCRVVTKYWNLSLWHFTTSIKLFPGSFCLCSLHYMYAIIIVTYLEKKVHLTGTVVANSLSCASVVLDWLAFTTDIISRIIHYFTGTATGLCTTTTLDTMKKLYMWINSFCTNIVDVILHCGGFVKLLEREREILVHSTL